MLFLYSNGSILSLLTISSCSKPLSLNSCDCFRLYKRNITRQKHIDIISEAFLLTEIYRVNSEHWKRVSLARKNRGFATLFSQLIKSLYSQNILTTQNSKVFWHKVPRDPTLHLVKENGGSLNSAPQGAISLILIHSMAIK